MTYNSFRAAFCAAVALCLCCAVRGDFTVAADGVPQADIVVPGKANAIERYAADELRHHLAKMVGSDFAVIAETDLGTSKTRHHFFLGATKAAQAEGLLAAPLALEEHRVKTVGGNLFLFGRDVVRGDVADLWAKCSRGTMYAVYDFLTKSCGVRWLWPGEKGECVPRRRDLSFGDMDRGGVEPIQMRLFYGARGKPTKGFFNGFRDQAARERYYADVIRFLLRHRLGTRRHITQGHSFQQYWKRFGETHPEYFNLLPDGKRRPLNGDRSGASVTMCVSEPGLWRQIAEDWRERILRAKAAGDEIYVGICENDSPGMCTCPRCRAWDAPSDLFAKSDYWNGSGKDPLTCGNRFWRLCDVRWGELGCDWTKPPPPDVSDRYARFYNAVLAEVRKIEPSARVIGYGYSNYAEGPKQTKMSPGVTVEYVPRNYFPYHAEDSAHLRREWDAWRTAGTDEMLFRPNYMLAGANFPIDFARHATADIAYIATNGLVGCRFDSLMGAWGAQPAHLYAIIRSLSEPTLGYEAAVSELSAAFGPAEAAVRRYFKFVEDFSESVKYMDYVKIGWKNRCSKLYPAGGHNRFTNLVHDLYPASFFEQGAVLLEAAEKAAAPDAEVQGRVRFLKEGFEDARLTWKTQGAFRAMKADGSAANKAAFEAAFREMREYRASIEGDDIANFDVHARNEAWGIGWPHEAAIEANR